MKSIEEIYKTYEKPLFHYFYGLTGDYNLAEELTQETFFQIIRTISGFRKEAQLTTWLYKVARNVFSMWKRKQIATRFMLEVESLKSPVDREPEQVLERKENLALTMEILKNLSDSYREVLWLRDWHELTYEQISVITGRSLSWVKVTLHRARLQFRQSYRDKEGRV